MGVSPSAASPGSREISSRVSDVSAANAENGTAVRDSAAASTADSAPAATFLFFFAFLTFLHLSVHPQTVVRLRAKIL